MRVDLTWAPRFLGGVTARLLDADFDSIQWQARACYLEVQRHGITTVHAVNGLCSPEDFVAEILADRGEADAT